MSEDTLETQTESKVDIVKTEIEAARGCTKLHETAKGPVEIAEASEEAIEEELWAEHPTCYQVGGILGYKVCPMNES